jgi:hypothetical protein
MNSNNNLWLSLKSKYATQMQNKFAKLKQRKNEGKTSTFPTSHLSLPPSRPAHALDPQSCFNLCTKLVTGNLALAPSTQNLTNSNFSASILTMFFIDLVSLNPFANPLTANMTVQ